VDIGGECWIVTGERGTSLLRHHWRHGQQWALLGNPSGDTLSSSDPSNEVQRHLPQQQKALVYQGFLSFGVQGSPMQSSPKTGYETGYGEKWLSGHRSRLYGPLYAFSKVKSSIDFALEFSKTWALVRSSSLGQRQARNERDVPPTIKTRSRSDT
jgi:hypothetical protein